MLKIIKNHSNICCYGLGQAFDSIIKNLSKEISINYLSDDNIIKLKKINANVKIIKPQDLIEIENLFVIVTTSFVNYINIKKFLDLNGIENCIFNEITELKYPYPIVRLNKIYNKYDDHLGNQIIINNHTKFKDNNYIFFGKQGSGIISQNNKLYIDYSCLCTGSLEIKFLGQNSEIKISNSIWINHMKIHIGSSNKVKIGSQCTFEEIFINAGESGNVEIGNDCMFSDHIEIWQTDGHPIFDVDSGNRINSERNIIIKDHVWVGTHTHLLGGAFIPKGTILGARTVTSGKFTEENSVIAGNPAKIIRRNIKWQKDEVTVKKISHITQTYNYSMLNNNYNVYILGDHWFSKHEWKKITDIYKLFVSKPEWLTTKDVLQLLDQIIYYKPKFIFLHLGNSDLLLSQQPINKIFDRYKKILNSLTDQSIIVIPLLNLEIKSKNFGNINIQIKDLKKLLIQYFNDLSIQYIDINMIISNNNLSSDKIYDNDDFNLSEESYKVIENNIISIIEKLDNKLVN